MSRKTPYIVPTKTAQTAKPAESAAPAKPAMSAVRIDAAVEAVMDARGPSLRQAQTYRVDERNYTVREREQAQLAMDFNGTSLNALTFVENTGFPGFPTLALLAQLPEYRAMHETLADECVRCWGKVVSAGSTDAAKLQDIEAELERIDLPAIIRQAVVHDQAFGGADRERRGVGAAKRFGNDVSDNSKFQKVLSSHFETWSCR